MSVFVSDTRHVFLGEVGIYGDARGELMALLHGHTGGVTHLRFSHDGHRLYSGARKVSLLD